MKRHLALEPFSRDHNDGLILARHLDLHGSAALAEFRAAWDAELRDHFEEEERLLGPLCRASEFAQMSQEHREIRALGVEAQDDDAARELGRRLHDHIRWEERVLFVAIEGRATESELAALASALEPLETRRGVANPLRAELVRRRRSGGSPS